jgi:hypothetical protein
MFHDGNAPFLIVAKLLHTIKNKKNLHKHVKQTNEHYFWARNKPNLGKDILHKEYQPEPTASQTKALPVEIRLFN